MTNAGEVNVKLGLSSEEFMKAIIQADEKIVELEKSLKKSNSEFEKAAKVMATTKNPTKSMVMEFEKLKQAVQNDQKALDNFKDKLDPLGKSSMQGASAVSELQKAFENILTVGAIVTVTKQLMNYAKESVEAFRTQQIALASLNNSLQNSGVYSYEFSQNIQELSSEIQKFTNYDDDAVSGAVALGQSFLGNTRITNDLIKATIDYSAATGTDLQTAFILVGKSVGTNTNALARYGVELKEGMSTSEKMAAVTQILSQRYKNQAEVTANASEQLKNSLGDLSEVIGEWLNPAVEKSQKLLAGLANSATEAIWQFNTAIKKTNELSLKQAKFMLSEVESGPQWIQSLKWNKDHAQQLKERIALLEKEEKIKAKTSAINYKAVSEGAKSAADKKETDKALETYKKYVEEFKKVNNDYQASLQAAEYIENTLGVNPVTQRENYTELLSLYQDYFSKSREIAESGARNKAELLKLNEQKLRQDLQILAIEKEKETQQKLYDLMKGYQDQRREYEIKSQAQEQLGGFLGRYQTGYQEKLQLLQWYYKEQEKIADMHYSNMEQKQQAYNELDQTMAVKAADIEKSIWEKRGQDITSIFNQTFDSMLTNYGDFSENMQQLALNLSRYLMKEVLQAGWTQLSQSQGFQNAFQSMSQSFLSFANITTGATNTIAQSAQVASAGTQAMVASQTAFAPIAMLTGQVTKTSASNYAEMAIGAQEAAIAIANLAIANAANSVASIPYAGAILAPIAALATSAAITAAWGLTSAAGLGSAVLGRGATAVSSFGRNPGGGGMMMDTDPLPIYHSGGLVPGTKEQLAVLKGGERVLNPAEATSYGDNEQLSENSVNNVMMFNIKAWDGKDVINTLKANSQVINQIVSSGIKNNQQGLRTTVQNV